MLYLRTLDEHVDEMKNAANAFVSYSMPLVSRHDDGVLLPLKQRVATLEGIEVLLTFSRNLYGDTYVETLELMATKCPFLPMHLVCKIATRFLGGHDLVHFSYYCQGHKVYSWKVYLDERGRPLGVKPKNAIAASYGDFHYSLIYKTPSYH